MRPECASSDGFLYFVNESTQRFIIKLYPSGFQLHILQFYAYWPLEEFGASSPLHKIAHGQLNFSENLNYSFCSFSSFCSFIRLSLQATCSRLQPFLQKSYLQRYRLYMGKQSALCSHKRSYKSVSRCSSVPGNRSARAICPGGVWGSGSLKRLAPLSHQALWLSGSFKSHRDANKPIGLTLAATSGRDFCRMNQKLSALGLWSLWMCPLLVFKFGQARATA